MVPVCAPSLLSSGPSITEPADCLQYPLLQDAERADWMLWLRAHGLDSPISRKGSSFSDDALLVKAAIAGQGIALVRDLHASAEIASGGLMQLLHKPWPTDFAYYLLASEERKEDWTIVAFRTWILDQVAEDAAGKSAGSSSLEVEFQPPVIVSFP
jgi:LysR family glycine cleavage system transcriptional activator